MNIEIILHQDNVSRLIDIPRMYQTERGLIWDEIFQFPKGRPESVVWRKYATSDEEVHSIGCQREGLKRTTKPDMRYAGFITSKVEQIRNIRNINGHGFQVLHEPKEGVHHAEISYAPNDKPLSKPDKAELRLMLRNCFGTLSSHSCPSG